MTDYYMRPEGRSGEKKTYTVEEVAEMLDISLRTAYNFCGSTDKFIVKRTGKRGIRINKASFDHWLDSPDGCEK